MRRLNSLIGALRCDALQLILLSELVLERGEHLGRRNVINKSRLLVLLDVHELALGQVRLHLLLLEGWYASEAIRISHAFVERLRYLLLLGPLVRCGGLKLLRALF